MSLCVKKPLIGDHVLHEAGWLALMKGRRCYPERQSATHPEDEPLGGPCALTRGPPKLIAKPQKAASIVAPSWRVEINRDRGHDVSPTRLPQPVRQMRPTPTLRHGWRLKYERSCAVMSMVGTMPVFNQNTILVEEERVVHEAHIAPAGRLAPRQR